MKTPIEVKGIRKGDIVRVQFVDTRADPARAIEYTARHDKHGWGGAHQTYYLLDRPTSPVELPTAMTLGWISVEDEAHFLGAWRSDPDVDEHLQPAANGAVGWDLWQQDTYYNVTAFTPAVAVPKAALDELRRVDGLCDATYPDTSKAITTFLRAVDNANGDRA